MHLGGRALDILSALTERAGETVSSFQAVAATAASRHPRPLLERRALVGLAEPARVAEVVIQATR